MVKDNEFDVIIVGAGPAGIFSAYTLVNSGKTLRIAIVDRGKDIHNRTCPMRDKNTECKHCKVCHIMNGFGGAGTFSDCKLSLTPFGVGGNITDYVSDTKAIELIKKVEEIYGKFDNNNDARVIFGNPDDISESLKAKLEFSDSTLDVKHTVCPTKHLGTDGTYEVMKHMYEYLKNMGVEFYFDCEIYHIISSHNRHQKYVVEDKKGQAYTAKYVILAPGRSGNAWLKQILDRDFNVPTKKGKLDIGVRVETDANVTKNVTNELYDMKLSCKFNDTGDTARTFCTNPNGYVAEEHYTKDGIQLATVNGHSFANTKSDRTNFAILIRVNEDLFADYAYKLINIANSCVNGKTVVQNFVDFAKNQDYRTAIEHYATDLDKNYKTKDKLTLKDAEFFDLNLILPSRITREIINFMGRLNYFLMPGLASGSTYIYGIEAKFYSNTAPVNNNFELIDNNNIYCIGDGAGITRGITQAASTGIVAAEDILAKLS